MEFLYFSQGKAHNYYTYLKKGSKLTGHQAVRIRAMSWWKKSTIGGVVALTSRREKMISIYQKNTKLQIPRIKLRGFTVTVTASGWFNLKSNNVDAIETRRQSGHYKSALEAEMISRMSIFHKIFVEKKRNWSICLTKSFFNSVNKKIHNKYDREDRGHK